MNTEGEKLIPVDIETEMKKSFLDYSMSVITSRALPDVRDGLKPVHRRILYTMYEDNLTPDKPYRKCATSVGDVLGRYHPHGDASVYDALVRLAQDFSLRYPLVDGHGNFGSIDGDPPAAYRYTESRMSKIALEMLSDIDKDTVDFEPNYDDRLKEPTVLPSRFPNLLVNGSSGIAVGMATNIPPHNLTEVINGMVLLIDNPDASLEEIMTCIKGPDFPTGGIIMGRAGIREAYTKGRGRLTLRAKTEIEEEKNGRFRIVVTEIPYMVNKSRLIEGIANLHKEKRINGISDLRDESDREGMRIVIELKREANPNVVLNQLFMFSQLQVTIPVILLCLVKGEPKYLPLKDMLMEYIRFQEQVVKRRTQFELKKAEDRAHILEGLKIAIDYIDEVIQILRSSKSIADGKNALMERFGLDDIQAQAIVQMRLGQLTGLERDKVEKELADLLEKIKEYNAILADESRILAIVKEEAIKIRDKYGDERRTHIETVTGEVDVEDLISNEECVITLSHFGYIKRQPVSAYHSQRRGGRGVIGMNNREEDFAKDLFVCLTHDYIMFFSNFGRVYKLKAYEIMEGSRTSKGINIINLLPISQGEKITAMIHLPEFEDDKYLIMVTKNGIIKRTSLSQYETARKGGIIGIILDENDELSWVHLTDGNSEVIVGTKKGFAIRFKETDVRPMGRVSRGVKAIALEDGDEVVGMSVVRENSTLLSVTENGFGKRSDISEYHVQNRAGKGLMNYKVNEKTGMVACIDIVDSTDDIMIISSDGVIIRINASEIPVYKRGATGVHVMRVAQDAHIVSFARSPHEEEKDDENRENNIDLQPNN
jgi:DNA gyrase subunit A